MAGPRKAAISEGILDSKGQNCFRRDGRRTGRGSMSVLEDGRRAELIRWTLDVINGLYMKVVMPVVVGSGIDITDGVGEAADRS